MADLVQPGNTGAKRSLLILQNAAADTGTAEGAKFQVDFAPNIRFSIDVATGGVIEIYGVDLSLALDGSVTEVESLLGTFVADNTLSVENTPRFDSVYAKTTTKPTAGTAKVYLTRSNI
jgi:hypothetical protein